MKVLTKDERIELLRVRLIAARNILKHLDTATLGRFEAVPDMIDEINFTLKTTEYAVKRQTKVSGVTGDIFPGSEQVSGGHGIRGKDV